MSSLNRVRWLGLIAVVSIVCVSRLPFSCSIPWYDSKVFVSLSFPQVSHPLVSFSKYPVDACVFFFFFLHPCRLCQVPKVTEQKIYETETLRNVSVAKHRQRRRHLGFTLLVKENNFCLRKRNRRCCFPAAVLSAKRPKGFRGHLDWV